MTKLEELIKKLCPDGVEYVKIKEISKVLRGKRLTKNELSDEYTYPVYHGGLEPLGYYFESNRPANTVMVINVGASAGTIGYSEEAFWSSDGCFCIAQSNKLLPRYLYHYLKNNEHYFQSKVRKAGIPTLDNFIVEDFSIPLPPLPIQEEIVRILDKFTSLTAELQAELKTELKAKRQQYEYYREKLLTFGDDVERVKLEEIARYSKDRIPSSDVDENTYVGVDNLLQDKKGKTISSHVPTEGSLTKYHKKDILIGNIRPYLRKIWFADNDGGTNGDVLTIQTISDKIIPKFLFVILSSENFFNYDMNNSKGTKMPRGDKEAVMRYIIPLPLLSEQERIVAILDRFDKLCNDITDGLPVEIEARQKQYEYYRDKLLTFKRKD